MVGYGADELRSNVKGGFHYELTCYVHVEDKSNLSKPPSE